MKKVLVPVSLQRGHQLFEKLLRDIRMEQRPVNNIPVSFDAQTGGEEVHISPFVRFTGNRIARMLGNQD